MHNSSFDRIEETNFRYSSGRLPRLLLCLALALAAAPAPAQTTYTPYTFTTWAGSPGVSGTNDGTGAAARFNSPAGLAVDAIGNVFVADFYNNTVRKVTPGRVVTTLAGLGGSSGTNDGIGAAARFNGPNGVAADGAGNLYVTDRDNSAVRKLSPNGTNWTVTTLAGLAGNAGSADGTGSAARFYRPGNLALNSATNLYVADTSNNTIRKVTPAGVVTTVAGLAGSAGSTDGTNSAARFSLPDRVAVDSADNIYVADYGNSTIRKITPVGTNWVVTTLAGLAGNPGTADGTNSDARFNSPEGVVVDSAGNIYVGDWGNYTIRKITPMGTNWVVTTLAGLPGNPGTADGTGSAARFVSILGVAVASVGDLYIPDAGTNSTILKGWPSAGGAAPVITTQPASLTVAAFSEATFSAAAIGAQFPGFQWQKRGTNLSDGENITGASTDSLTVSNCSPNDAAGYSVVVSNAFGVVTSAVAILTVTSSPPIITQPLSQTVNAGDNAAFAVAVVGTGLQFQWRFNGTNLVGQTNSALTLNSIGTNQAGIYDVQISLGTASLLSDPAELMVLLPGQPGSKKWQFTYGLGIHTTPALAKDGTIYVVANGALIALNPSGTERWLLPLPGVIYVAPTVSPEGTIYVGAHSTNLLYAVNPSGTLLWSLKLPDGFFTYAPSLAEDGTILAPPGAGDPLTARTFYAVNTNGTVRWTFDAGGRPSGAAVGYDRTINLGNQDTNYFDALNPDGTARWSINPFPMMWGMPIIGSDGTVYAGTWWEASLHALGPDGGGRWQFAASGGIGTSPSLAADGTIYCLSQDGHLYALNPDGSDKWVYDLAAVSYSSPAVSKHGTIYTSANDKRFLAINPDGTTRWEFVTGSADTNPYEGRRPSATIAPDGTVYFAVIQPGYIGVLYAIQGDSGPAESPWPMEFQNAQHTSRVPFALTNQPATQIVLGGSNVFFSVGVASTQPCVFQWRHNGSDLPNQTNALLLLPSVASDAEGFYACFVSNRSGAFVSYNASLTVLFPPVITQQPTNLFVLAGSNVLLAATATGTPPLSYQWALNGTRLPGVTNTALSLSNVSGLNAGFYTVVVSNLTGSVTSTPALLDVRYTLAYGNGGLLPGSNYTFVGSVALQLRSVFQNGNIFYTLDGSEPSFASSYYAGPFSLNRSAILRVIAYRADFSKRLRLPRLTSLSFRPTRSTSHHPAAAPPLPAHPPALT